MRTAPVGGVVIDTVAAAALTLGLRREMADVAVVVVAPQESHVVRHLQACLIYILHFLVGDEHLRHVVDAARHVFGEQRALILEHLLQHLFLFLNGRGAVHGSIVQTAHSQRVNHGLAGGLLHALFPEGKHVILVVYIVVLSHSTHAPLAIGVAAHRLAMTGSDEDAVLGGQLTEAFGQEEGLCDLVHRRPV